MAVKHVPGPGHNILKALSILKDKGVKVGWFETSKYEDGTQVAYVASIHEYGFAPKNIPPRLGLRQMQVDKKQSWAETSLNAAKAVIRGKPALDMLEAIGGLVEGHVREQIKSVTEPPLKPATIAARARKTASGEVTKSLTKPLNDTGYLMATVTHVVGDKESSPSGLGSHEVSE